KDGARDKAIADIKEDEEEITEQAIAKYVAKLPITPGPPLAVGDLGRAAPQRIAHGKEVYAKARAPRPGARGKGGGVQKRVTSRGFLQGPGDQSAGIYKGQDDPASLYRRVRLGLPGSSMPSNSVLSHQEIADVVFFVLSLSDERMRQSHVVRRQS